MLTITTISLYALALWFVGGFFIGLGWHFSAWVVARVTARFN